MLEKLAGIEARYEELNALMSDPAVTGDYNRLREVGQERSELEPIVEALRRFKTIQQELEDSRVLAASEGDAEMAAMAHEEVIQLEQQARQVEERLKQLLLPRDPADDKNVIVEIRAGTGGEEAALFAAELYRMYTRYAESRGWSIEMLSANDTGIGGFKEVIFQVKGKGAYSRLKFESGVHRVQRVPVTESSGRIHTSTATVAVLPEVQDVDVNIPESDLKIDVFRSSGAGGQNVQKNATAIRITHLPTGMVVTCQDERSQTQNRLRAMSILRARLYEAETEKRQKAEAADRKSQVGSGERSEKIRTYNFPQSRVTDHRIGVSSYNLPAVMDGAIDQFIDELSARDQAQKLSGTTAPAPTPGPDSDGDDE